MPTKQETQQEEETVPASNEVQEAMQAQQEAKEAQEAEEAELSALTLEEAEKGIDDGSRVAEGFTLAGMVERLKESVVIVKGAFLSLTAGYKSAANVYAESLRHVLRTDGIPDWSGTTATAVTLWQYAVDPVIASLEASETDRKRIKANITNHLNRHYRDLHLREHVAETATELREDGEVVLMFPDGPDNTNKLFLAYCREQYVKSGVPWANIPRDYWTTEDREKHAPGSGSGDSGPANPMATMRRGIEGAKQVVARYVVLTILSELTNLVQRIDAGDKSEAGAAPGFSSSEDKQYVAEILGRIEIVADYGGRLISEKATDADREGFLAASYSPDDDKVFADK